MSEHGETAALRHKLALAERQRQSDSLRIEELEEQLGQSRADMQHRIRNLLSVVRSIARRTAPLSESVEDYQSRLDGRLGALTRVQAALVRSPGAGLDLAAMVGDELLACGIRPGERARIDGEPIRLVPPAAEVMGLAVHELAVNALEHGALAAAGVGGIVVRWRMDVDECRDLRVDWTEAGGPGTGGELRHGFGTEVIRKAIAYQLAGTALIDLSERGLHCRICLPASCVAGFDVRG